MKVNQTGKPEKPSAEKRKGKQTRDSNSALKEGLHWKLASPQNEAATKDFGRQAQH
jgi:hypothetical protein